MQYVFGIILLLSALFLIIAVLMQQGKSHNLSGTIAGGAETFFGKSKGKTLDKKLSKLTTIVAIIFAVLVLFVYVIQPDINPNIKLNGGLKWALSPNYVYQTNEVEDTTPPADTSEDTDAETDAETDE